MEHQICKGLVIRENDFSDQDRYISVLTVDGKRIEVLCKGVRRRGGRMTNAVRLFCYSEFTIYQGRGEKYVLVNADLIASFWGVTQSIEAYALCCYLAQLVGYFTDAGQECPQAARIFLYALRAIADQKRDPVLVKGAMELRLLAESGYTPHLSTCSVCDAVLVQPIWFSPSDGVCRCNACAQRLGTTGYFSLMQGTYSAILHSLTQEIPRIYSFTLGGNARVQLAEICEAYALFHAGRGFESLKFYHSLQQGGLGVKK